MTRRTRAPEHWSPSPSPMNPLTWTCPPPASRSPRPPTHSMQTTSAAATTPAVRRTRQSHPGEAWTVSPPWFQNQHAHALTSDNRSRRSSALRGSHDRQTGCGLTPTTPDGLRWPTHERPRGGQPSEPAAAGDSPTRGAPSRHARTLSRGRRPNTHTRIVLLPSLAHTCPQQPDHRYEPGRSGTTLVLAADQPGRPVTCTDASRKIAQRRSATPWRWSSEPPPSHPHRRY
jgi:hypothetical protein